MSVESVERDDRHAVSGSGGKPHIAVLHNLQSRNQRPAACMHRLLARREAERPAGGRFTVERTIGTLHRQFGLGADSRLGIATSRRHIRAAISAEVEHELHIGHVADLVLATTHVSPVDPGRIGERKLVGIVVAPEVVAVLTRRQPDPVHQAQPRHSGHGPAGGVRDVPRHESRDGCDERRSQTVVGGNSWLTTWSTCHDRGSSGSAIGDIATQRWLRGRGRGIRIPSTAAAATTAATTTSIRVWYVIRVWRRGRWLDPHTRAVHHIIDVLLPVPVVRRRIRSRLGRRHQDRNLIVDDPTVGFDPPRRLRVGDSDPVLGGDRRIRQCPIVLRHFGIGVAVSGYAQRLSQVFQRPRIGAEAQIGVQILNQRSRDVGIAAPRIDPVDRPGGPLRFSVVVHRTAGVDDEHDVSWIEHRRGLTTRVELVVSNHRSKEERLVGHPREDPHGVGPGRGLDERLVDEIKPTNQHIGIGDHHWRSRSAVSTGKILGDRSGDSFPIPQAHHSRQRRRIGSILQLPLSERHVADIHRECDKREHEDHQHSGQNQNGPLPLGRGLRESKCAHRDLIASRLERAGISHLVEPYVEVGSGQTRNSDLRHSRSRLQEFPGVSR